MDFRRMRFLINRLPMARFRLLKAKSQATRTTAVLSDMPHGTGVTNPTERGFFMIEMAREAVENIETELAEMQKELSAHMGALTDPLEEQAMQMRYFEGRSVREIAYSLNYSERWIFKVLGSAERKITKRVH